ncbi:toxin-antitoxin system YwqK family antitoxin [Mucilaginibacter pedocola]|uniref:Membrane-binding protein n=1 Tax=Mucilaginibacter pedocola TaxID=1792845 RepID=A0A1S9PBH7_9SPHI|nr:hypothetical protein [Mucilaginibacter pedocola]OOQ58333.1 hypothetical protein BC343_11915 [Mucilaginibacter pedocola]
MKSLRLIAIALLIGARCLAQDMPPLATDRVRIIGPEETKLFDVRASNKAPEADASKMYYWYSANEIHTTQGGYSGKPLNGSYAVYYANKQLKEQGSFDRGLKDGTWKAWTSEGVLLKSENWGKGILSGPFVIYNEGKPARAGHYKNGVLNGLLVNYHAAGLPADTLNYKNGKAVPIKPPFIKRIHLFGKKRPAADTLKRQ